MSDDAAPAALTAEVTEPIHGPAPLRLAAGDVVLTATGRPTTPFPRIDLTTERRALGTVKRINAWLIGNARAEAEARSDEWMMGQLGAIDLRNLSQSDMDGAELYLFGRVS